MTTDDSYLAHMSMRVDYIQISTPPPSSNFLLTAPRLYLCYDSSHSLVLIHMIGSFSKRSNEKQFFKILFFAAVINFCCSDK